MTRIKMCGLSRSCDIETVNRLGVEYVGFVFAVGSRRYVTPEKARELKNMLDPGCKAVGVFVNEGVEAVAGLLERGIIDIAQLHGREDEDYIRRLKMLTRKPVIKAFSISTGQDIHKAELSSADLVLLDAGSGGLGTTFDWKLIPGIKRPYFLAGGLTPGNVGQAIALLHPYAVDVSSGIESDHFKDKAKMTAFAGAVREADAANNADTGRKGDRL